MPESDSDRFTVASAWSPGGRGSEPRCCSLWRALDASVAGAGSRVVVLSGARCSGDAGVAGNAGALTVSARARISAVVSRGDAGLDPSASADSAGDVVRCTPPGTVGRSSRSEVRSGMDEPAGSESSARATVRAGASGSVPSASLAWRAATGAGRNGTSAVSLDAVEF